jgi:hypothetical protein
MNATIKKYKGNWLVADNNGGWVGFVDHDEAIQYALDQGASKVTIKYSPSVLRVFDRDTCINFVLAR